MTKAVGDAVDHDELVCTVEFEKAAVDIRAPATGTLTQVPVSGGVVEDGDVVVKVRVPSSDVSGASSVTVVAKAVVGDAGDQATSTHHRALHDAHIPMMEPTVAAAASVDFATLSAPAGVAALDAVLKEHGFAIVTNVVSPAEIAAAEQLWAADLRAIVDEPKSADKELVGSVSADPISRWPLDQWPLGKRFVTGYGLPHGALAWWARQHANVRRVFAHLFQTDELCCGTDVVFFNNRRVVAADARSNATTAPASAAVGASNATPPSTDAFAVPPLVVPSLAALRSPLWPHVDQNAHLPPAGTVQAYQGVLYLWPAQEDTGATVVLPRSHRDVYSRLMQRSGRDTKGHGCLWPKQDFQFFADSARRVPVPAGSLLLWDSKTSHQGWPLGARLAVPVCFEPVERRPPAVRRAKLRAVKEGLPTSHWASLGTVHMHVPRQAAEGPPSSSPMDGVVLRHTGHRAATTPDGDVKPEVAALL